SACFGKRDYGVIVRLRAEICTETEPFVERSVGPIPEPRTVRRVTRIARDPAIGMWQETGMGEIVVANPPVGPGVTVASPREARRAGSIPPGDPPASERGAADSVLFVCTTRRRPTGAFARALEAAAFPLGEEVPTDGPASEPTENRRRV
ncbi:hypothetical protein PanWU01x14_103440, partial [Parasponia andersonii]